MLTKVADIGFDDQLDPLQKEFLEEALLTTRNSRAGSPMIQPYGSNTAASTSKWAIFSASWGVCRNRKKPI